jgi:DNA modification methylase
MREILAESPDDHFILWHDLEAERHAIEKAVPESISVYGSQDLDKREKSVIDFRNGKIKYLAGKPQMLGSGPNFQYHCHRAVFLGIGYKFKDFIQAIHRLYRFLQKETVRVDIIYAESEKLVLERLQEKWKRHDEQAAIMSGIIKQYGLSHEAMAKELTRGFGIERTEIKGENYTLVNNDCVDEVRRMESNSVGLVVTSIPFSTQYEYSPNYADFGHTDNNEHFFEQMDFFTPELFRVLQPGRIAAIHVKDRIVPGGLTGLGFQTVYRFSDKVCDHFEKHGFGFMGRKTIVTDVVRENNQTYRLGWSEQCKDGTKMGVGMSEYLLIFRKPQTDNSKAYADLPVVKSKNNYSRSRWQIDAHGFTRSSGNRLLASEDFKDVPHSTIFKLFRKFSRDNVYDFEKHVRLCESLETCTTCRHIHTGNQGKCSCGCTGQGRLPTTFMLLQPQSWSEDVWTDITRMRTLNSNQYSMGRQMHLCPLQFDIADRAIVQYSNPGELVLDPFGGLGTVAHESVKLGRRGYSIELNTQYFLDSVVYCEAAAQKAGVPTLFDLAEVEETEIAEDLAA